MTSCRTIARGLLALVMLAHVTTGQAAWCTEHKAEVKPKKATTGAAQFKQKGSGGAFRLSSKTAEAPSPIPTATD